ncbi:hypothetical protein [Candidatus Poriferisocius sp.]|uniref:hypothetical protein n=1 Tax=Candidatus Poriferisocius sp. TaxID=3101276 RepID=UPI003B022AB8
MEYKKAFPGCFRVILVIMYLAILATFFTIVISTDPPNASEAEDWSRAGRWTIGILVTPFVALMGTYVWAQSRVKVSSRKVSLVSFVFPSFGASLVGGVTFLMLYEISEDSVHAALGLWFSVSALISMLAAALTVVQVWDVSRAKDSYANAEIES